jgi:hypothetical protein
MMEELRSNLQIEHHNTVGEHIDIRWKIGDHGRRSMVREIGRCKVGLDEGLENMGRRIGDRMGTSSDFRTFWR